MMHALPGARTAHAREVGAPVQMFHVKHRAPAAPAGARSGADLEVLEARWGVALVLTQIPAEERFEVAERARIASRLDHLGPWMPPSQHDQAHERPGRTALAIEADLERRAV